MGRIFLGKYETLRLLGEGGMGRVYLARQIDLGRQVVVKVMHDHVAADPKFRERFQRETLLMARFQHPYVVTLFDASLNDPGGPCIIMEYIRGVPLDTLLLRNGRLTPQRVGRLLGQLCEALQAAHNESIIHRDLKPANLMVVDGDTPYEKIKVMDFGLAKMLDAATAAVPRVTDTGADFAVGTPGYISPEQVRGDEMDHRADLYSVGVILYELLAGRLPFTGSETMDVLLAHATEKPPSFADVGVDWVPPAVERVVQRCLAKQPGDRPQSARELAEIYDGALARLQSPSGRFLRPTPPPTDPEIPREAPATTPSVSANTPAPAALAERPAELDPNAVVHHLEAWMPERIAVYKLRGFIDDVGGQVVENVPGRIRVRLGGKGSIYQVPSQGALSWLGIGRKGVVDMELLLERNNPTQQNLLTITVLMRSPEPGAAVSTAWRERCSEIFCDLRAYLMGNGAGAQG
jgi:serine/threonine-protein kinase